MNEMYHENSEFVSQEIGARRPVKIQEKTALPARQPQRNVKKRSLFIKSCICAVVCAGCLLLKVIDTPATQQATQTIRDMISYDLDMEDSIGKLKFVQNIFPGLEAVFSNSAAAMQYPVQGSVVQNFRENGCQGVRIHALANGEVAAAADGILLKRAVSQEHGNYLRIKHPNGMETVYYGLAQSPLPEGTDVGRGDVIGTLTDSGVLYFEVYKNGTVQNPLSFFGVE